MKRLLAIFGFILVFSFAISSCNKEDAKQQETNTEQNQTSDELVTLNFEEGFAVYEITGVVTTPGFNFVDFKFNKNGVETTFSEFLNGKPAFLNFWGTWCPPCRKEIPDIIEISNENSDLVVVGIALEKPADLLGKRRGVEEYGSAKGLTYVNFIINPNIERDLIMAYGGINAVPTTYMLKNDGSVSDKIVGSRSKEDFMISVNQILNKGA